MTRSVSKEKQHEYDELKKFFTHWQTHLATYQIFPLDHPYNPLNVLASFELRFGISRSLIGLKQAVNDILESYEDFSPDQISKADLSLASVGAPTLTQLWRTRSRQYKAILRRRFIRDDTEFYLVSSVLADTASQVSTEDREALDAMVASYELQRA